MTQVIYSVTIIWKDGSYENFSELENVFTTADWLVLQFLDGSEYGVNREEMRYYRQTEEERDQ